MEVSDVLFGAGVAAARARNPALVRPYLTYAGFLGLVWIGKQKLLLFIWDWNILAQELLL